MKTLLLEGLYLNYGICHRHDPLATGNYAAKLNGDPIGVKHWLTNKNNKYRAVGTEHGEVAYLRHAKYLKWVFYRYLAPDGAI